MSAERRCTCGMPLFVPTPRSSAKDPDVQLDAVLLTFLKRDLWRWLLPAPFWFVAVWVLQTSERVWTATLLFTSRAGHEVVTVGDLGRQRLIAAVLFFAVAPALVAWLLRRRHASTSASDGEPPPTWHLAVEWTVRLAALVWIAWITHFLWSYR